MNYCLRHQCNNGYAVLDGLKFRYDNFGAYRYWIIDIDLIILVLQKGNMRKSNVLQPFVLRLRHYRFYKLNLYFFSQL